MVIIHVCVNTRVVHVVAMIIDIVGASLALVLSQKRTYRRYMYIQTEKLNLFHTPVGFTWA